MGQLIHIEELHKGLGIKWYFNELPYKGRPNRDYLGVIQDTAFPHTAAIHSDHMNKIDRVEMRRLVERQFVGIVVKDSVDHNYYHQYGKYSEDGYQVSNHWNVFLFEEDADAVLFKLKYQEYIRPVTLYHPDKPEHIDEKMKHRMEWAERRWEEERTRGY